MITLLLVIDLTYRVRVLPVGVVRQCLPVPLRYMLHLLRTYGRWAWPLPFINYYYTYPPFARLRCLRLLLCELVYTQYHIPAAACLLLVRAACLMTWPYPLPTAVALLLVGCRHCWCVRYLRCCSCR